MKFQNASYNERVILVKEKFLFQMSPFASMRISRAIIHKKKNARKISPVIFNYFNYTDKRTNFPDETSVSVSSSLYFDILPASLEERDVFLF